MPNQIRVQMPFDYSGTNTGSAYVRLNNLDGTVSVSNAINLTIVPANPGIFSMGTATPPQAIAVHASSYASAIVSVDGTITAGNTATVSVNGTALHVHRAGDRYAEHRTSCFGGYDQHGSPSDGHRVECIYAHHHPGAGSPVQQAMAFLSPPPRAREPRLSSLPSIRLPAVPTQRAVRSPLRIRPRRTNSSTFLALAWVFWPNGQGSPAGYPYLGPVPNSVDQANFVAATLAGSTAQVLNAGFPYGSIGIYQIELQMPASLTTSNNAQLYIAQNAFISNIVALPVTSSGATSLVITPNPIVVTNGGPAGRHRDHYL